MSAIINILLRFKRQGKQEIKSTESDIKSLLGTVAKTTAAIIAAGAAIKEAFDLSKEGAEVEQIERSFNTLNKTILHTPDLLEDLGDASRGTMSDIEMMRGVLLMTAGMTDEAAKAFAEAAPRLMEIAKAANKLNPALGDTAFLYDSITRGIKRTSPLILDNLGIVVEVGKANKDWAEANNTTVKAMSAQEQQMALLTAVLENGGNIIRQVGGDTDSFADSWGILAANVKNTSNEAKNALANSLQPLVRWIGGQYTMEVKDAAEATVELADANKDLRGAARELNDMRQQPFVPIAAVNELEGSMTQLAARAYALKRSGEDVEDFVEIMKRSFDDVYQLPQSPNMVYIGGILVSIEEIIGAYKNLAAAGADVAMMTRANTWYWQKYWGITKKGAWDFDNLHQIIKRMKVEQSQYNEALKEAEIRASIAAKTQREYTDSLRRAANAASGESFSEVIDMLTDEDTTLFNQTLGQIGDKLYLVSGKTAQQKDELERLNDAYEKAAETIRDYELGIRGANLDDDKRAAKIEEQVKIMETLSTSISEINSIQDVYGNTTVRATWNTQALNSLLYEQAKEAGASGISLMQLGIATGTFTEEQAKAALQAQLMKDKITELAGRIAEGLSIPEAMAELEDFRQEVESPYHLTVEATQASRELEVLKSYVSDLTSKRHKVYVDAEVNMPSGPPGVKSGGKGGAPSKNEPWDKPNRGQGYSRGGSFTVPHGFPNDTFPMRVSSGERVTVVPKNAQDAPRMGGMRVGQVIIQATSQDDGEAILERIAEAIGGMMVDGIESGVGVAGLV